MSASIPNGLNGIRSATLRDGRFNSSIDDDVTDVSLPDYDEVLIAITRLKNNKATGDDI